MKRYTLIVMMAFLLAASSPAMATDTPPGAATQTAPAIENNNCPKPPGTPMSAIFKDLEGINFYLEIPPLLQESIECRGKEKICANKYSDYEKAEERIRYYNEHYPEALLPSALTKLFLEQIETNLSPYVKKSGAQCSSPTVRVLNRQNSFQNVNNKNTITVNVRVFLDDIDVFSDRPENAVITIQLFRPDCGYSNYDSQFLSATMLIPLNLSEGQIYKRLKYLLDHSQLRAVFIKEDWS